MVPATMVAARESTPTMVSWLPSTILPTCSGVTWETRSSTWKRVSRKLSWPPVANSSSRICGRARMKSSAWNSTGSAMERTTATSTTIVSRDTSSDATMRFQR